MTEVTPKKRTRKPPEPKTLAEVFEPQLAAEDKAAEAGEAETFACSNPACGAVFGHKLDGSCPTCIRADGSGWSVGVTVV